MPLSDSDQTCLDFRLTITPPARISAYDLPSGRVHNFDVRSPHTELVIAAESLVVTHRTNPFAALQLVTDDSEFYTRDSVRQRFAEYLMPTQRVPLDPETDRIAAVARKQAGVGTASFLIALTRLLHRVFDYSPGATNVNTTITQVLENKQGVCQDFAHLMLAICRRQGIPSRYISGYLYTGEPEQDDNEPNTGAPTGRLVSGNAMHAWVECLMPGNEWRGFDPTNNMVTNHYYVKVHYGRDYGDALPVRGVYRGPFAHTLDVSVQVRRE
jgi:transglutaminase-like putative cysteine protease